MRRPAAVILATAVALVCTGFSTTAQAATTSDEQTESFILSWQETPGETIALESELLGHLTVVPGAHEERVLLVQNAGPSQATLTVSIVNATAVHGGTSWVDDSFYDDLLVLGLPAAELDGEETVALSAEVEQGGSVPVPLTVEFPTEATSGNTAVVGDREFTFDIRLTLSGPGAAAPATTGTGSDGTRSGSTGSGVGSVLTTSGATLVDPAGATLILAALALVAAAILARRRSLAVVRRRAADPGRGPSDGVSRRS